eukprot:TRINITY_DN25284_c0_g2_i2.p1 TRINITY_DN25284_c0_g2~~TRINITY_DN25284_c0_g2_i2.p1  ORF type:complete len:161 (+),score=36.58 TRINITY_DN25284_c0_g2_i2:75-557(+)
MTMKKLILVWLFTIVTAFPSLYQECVLPTQGFGAHQDPVGFEGSAYSMMLLDANDEPVYEELIPGETYKISVASSDEIPFRMVVFTTDGELKAAELEAGCEGKKITFDDVKTEHIAEFVAGDSDEVTISVNLANGCAEAYFQETITFPPELFAPTPEFED